MIGTRIKQRFKGAFGGREVFGDNRGAAEVAEGRLLRRSRSVLREPEDKARRPDFF
jgi:hypothetical protein